MTRFSPGSVPRVRMALAVTLFLCVAAVGSLADERTAAQGNALRTWNFDGDAAGVLPEGFVVGTLFDGRPAGDWRVLAAPDAPSPPHVLAQQMNRGAEHAYKVVLVQGTTATDLELEVSFLAVAGNGDRGGGLIWRARDDRNYYLARANPLEQNIRAYRVVKGVREQLVNFNQIIAGNQWHVLKMEARRDRMQVFYDGHPVLDLRESTFTAGRVGLWTKSDAVTHFDDLRLRILK